ncbi:MAG: tetratricopeptide repeat protein [bacterium]
MHANKKKPETCTAASRRVDSWHEAVLAFSNEQYEDALAQFKRVFAQTEQDAPAQLGAAVSAYRLGRLEEAEQQCKRGIRLDGKAPWPHYWLGQIFEAKARLAATTAEKRQVKSSLKSALREYCKAAKCYAGDPSPFWIPVMQLIRRHPELGDDIIEPQATRALKRLLPQKTETENSSAIPVDEMVYGLLKRRVPESERPGTQRVLAKLAASAHLHLEPEKYFRLAQYFAYQGEPGMALEFFRKSDGQNGQEMARAHVRYLCYLAAQTAETGDMRAAFRYLREARSATINKELSGDQNLIEQAYTTLNRNLFLRDFLSFLKGARLAPTFDVSRLAHLYRTLDSHAKSATLRLKLASRRTREAGEIWQEILHDSARDPIFNHSLALIYQEWAAELDQSGEVEKALAHWRCSLAFWLRILWQEEFWREMRKGCGLDEPGFQHQRQVLLENLLQRHLQKAEEYLTRGQNEAAEGHFNLLQTVCVENEPGLPRQQAGELRTALTQLREKWTDKYIQDARGELEKVENLATGIRQNYGTAVKTVQRLLDIDRENTRALHFVVDCYNNWCSDLFSAKQTEELETVAQQSIPYGDALSNQLEPGAPHVPENQTLVSHLMIRGIFAETELQNQIVLFQKGLEFCPGHEECEYCLQEKKKELSEVAYRDKLEEAGALAELGLFEDVIDRLQTIPESYSQYNLVRLLLGRALAQKGDSLAASTSKRALALYNQALDHLEKISTEEEARDNLQRRLADVHLRKGMILEKLGKKREAQVCYEKAKTIREMHE